jgi:histidyl-tRNA synthetase
MKNIWTIAELDAHKVFEVIPNCDPETSARFSLPIPNWLNEAGVARFEDPAIKPVDKKGKTELRFVFHNYEDGCDQAAKINGEGVIIFTSPTPAQVAALRRIISEYASDVSLLTPSDVKAILTRAYDELGLMDRFHGYRSDILSKMDMVGSIDADPAFGAFVYKPVVSSCVYLSGIGEFQEGPGMTPQIFENGCFVVFSGQSKKSVAALIKTYDLEKQTSRPSVKIVSKTMFLKSRRTPDQRPIDMEAIPAQDAPVKKYYKPKPISGFPEWTPEERDIERLWIRAIEEVFERYGFTNIETPAAEAVPVLSSKGEDVDKEIYGLQRLQAAQENVNEPRMALHYDLTVPMARYVAQHYGELTFPFKRYQIQKVWRGERPQKGRFREFTQCDIDVVDQDKVSLEFDAEFPMIIHSLVKKLHVGNVVIGVSNRKILQGFYQGLGMEDDEIVKVIRVVDKIGKIGDEGVRALLSEEIKLPEETINKCVALANIKETEASVTEKVLALGIDTPLLREGLKELDYVMERLRDLPKGSVVADLSIARGFDYYTGTVYEGKFVDYPDFPVILAGGRYDNLVGNFMNRSLPGVGISFGLTRVFSKLLAENKIRGGKSTPTKVLVVIPDEEGKGLARVIVDDLRERGVPSEVYHEPAKLAKQLEYADKKNIPFVLIPDKEDQYSPYLKDMRTGDQRKITSYQTWAPIF